jgi:hypothetical protein
VDEVLRVTAEHRGAEEVEKVHRSTFTAGEVDVIAVAREVQAAVRDRRRGKDLLVTPGTDIPEPQTLLTIVVLDIEDELAVR